MSSNEVLRFGIFHALPDDAERIRREVFMEEQGFVVEFDDTDRISTHIVVYVGGEPAGTCRLIPGDDGVCTLGRLAILRPYRRMGLGSKLVEEAERRAVSMRYRRMKLSAQVRVIGFYESLGFEASDEQYPDEGVPHITMSKDLVSD